MYTYAHVKNRTETANLFSGLLSIQYGPVGNWMSDWNAQFILISKGVHILKLLM